MDNKLLLRESTKNPILSKEISKIMAKSVKTGKDAVIKIGDKTIILKRI